MNCCFLSSYNPDHIFVLQKTLSAEYSSLSNDFVVTESPQNSLTKFLTDV